MVACPSGSSVTKSDGRPDGPVACLIENLDLAGANHEEREIAVADVNEHVAGSVGRERRARAAAKLRYLLVAERWKCYLVEIELRHGSFVTPYLGPCQVAVG